MQPKSDWNVLKFLILYFLHNKSFRHMIRATAIGYISRVLADQAQPLWVINPRSQNCEFYVHVVSLLLFSIVLFFVRDFFLFSSHKKIANFFISLLNQLFSDCWTFQKSPSVPVEEFLHRNKMEKIFIVDSDMFRRGERVRDGGTVDLQCSNCKQYSSRIISEGRIAMF